MDDFKKMKEVQDSLLIASGQTPFSASPPDLFSDKGRAESSKLTAPANPSKGRSRKTLSDEDGSGGGQLED